MIVRGGSRLLFFISSPLHARRPGEPPANVPAYQSLVGSLRFLADTTHPTLCHIVGVLGRHLHAPCDRHVAAAKHALRYLQGQRNSGLTFSTHAPLALTMASDSDYASDLDTQRSISGTLGLLGDQPVVWTSARQKTVTHSSTEAEYVAADTGARTLIWRSQL